MYSGICGYGASGEIVMEHYRLWYIQRGEQVQGPFPEALVCRYIVLGRVGNDHRLSLDGQYWRALHELPELIEAASAMVNVTQGVSADDVDWREERAKAALRWLDDRKSPDPRGKINEAEVDESQERRAARDRRLTPEFVEDHVYRENRGMFDAWSRMRRQHYGWAIAFVALVLALVVGAVVFIKPVHPVKVGLLISRVDCTAPAAHGVNWSGCDKEGELLIGADLRGAELSGARLKGARLRYADLTQADLIRADLSAADMTGARLDGAVWVDGHVCAENSIGVCK